MTNLWSPIDGVVLPPENGVLHGAHNVKVPWMTHWGFLWSKHIYQMVKDALLDHAEGQRTLQTNGADAGATTDVGKSMSPEVGRKTTSRS